MAETIFVSHAAADREVVSGVIEDLRERGLLAQDDTVIDLETGLQSGADWKGTLRAAIEAADKVLLVWSDTAARSAFVNYEAGLAGALDKPLLVAVRGMQSSELPLALRDQPVICLDP